MELCAGGIPKNVRRAANEAFLTDMASNYSKQNQNTWDKAAPLYYGHSALPFWGPYSIAFPKLIGKIKNKTFLEVGCGSGHSIRYLVRHGAQHVHGLDFSTTQINFARTLNQTAIDQKRVTLWHRAMESRIPMHKVDTVFSIFALGWSMHLGKTIALIHSYLKKNGRFVFSWEHPIFRHFEYQNRAYVPVTPFWNDQYRTTEWKKKWAAHLSYPTIEDWYVLLTSHGFEVRQMLEPRPRVFPSYHRNKKQHYANAKAKLLPSTIIFECLKK